MFPDSLPNLKFFLKQLCLVCFFNFQRQLSANMTIYIYYLQLTELFTKSASSQACWWLKQVIQTPRSCNQQLRPGRSPMFPIGSSIGSSSQWQSGKNHPAFAAVLQVVDLLVLHHTNMLLSFQQFHQSVSPERKLLGWLQLFFVAVIFHTYILYSDN